MSTNKQQSEPIEHVMIIKCTACFFQFRQPEALEEQREDNGHVWTDYLCPNCGEPVTRDGDGNFIWDDDFAG